jgi:hypothetical protein
MSSNEALVGGSCARGWSRRWISWLLHLVSPGQTCNGWMRYFIKKRSGQVQGQCGQSRCCGDALVRERQGRTRKNWWSFCTNVVTYSEAEPKFTVKFKNVISRSIPNILCLTPLRPRQPVITAECRDTNQLLSGVKDRSRSRSIGVSLVVVVVRERQGLTLGVDPSSICRSQSLADANFFNKNYTSPNTLSTSCDLHVWLSVRSIFDIDKPRNQGKVNCRMTKREMARHPPNRVQLYVQYIVQSHVLSIRHCTTYKLHFCNRKPIKTHTRPTMQFFSRCLDSNIAT